jgi:hypothetical protein
MDEHLDQIQADEQSRNDEPDREQRAPSQRELVMASLLRCPPEPADSRQ